MGLLVAMGVLPSDCLNEHVLLGELALDGSVRRVTGILPAALHAKASGILYALLKMAARLHGQGI